MSIRLVALDMDGTLLDQQHRIPPATMAVLREIRRRGAQICLITGRMYKSAAPYARQLDLVNMPLGAYSGGLVKVFPDGETLYHAPVPVSVAQETLRFAEERGYHCQAYVGNELFVEKHTDKTRFYCRVAGIEATAVGPLTDFIETPCDKLLIFEPESAIPGIRADLQQLLGDKANLLQSYPTFLEVTHPQATKGHALEKVAATLGVEQADVLAAGDAYNDLAMLRWAGHAIAMGHAPEEVRQAATRLAPPEPGHGLARALEDLLAEGFFD